MSNVRGSAYLLAALGATAWGISQIWHPAPPPKYRGLAAVRERIPRKVDTYRQEHENDFPDSVRRALASADLVSFAYAADGSDDTVDLTLIGGTDRNALHDPRSCMIGAGWRIEDDHLETLPGTALKARVCRVVGGSDATDYEVLYLYVVGDKIINEVTQIRTQMLLSALVGRKGTPVCFVRFMRPVPRGTADDPSTATRFRQFAGRAWNEMRIPGSI